MPQQYAVLCACGYTTLVYGSAVGTSVECGNCGAELEVDELSATSDGPVGDPAPLQDDVVQDQPESPLKDEAEHPVSSPPARSPFEEEDEEAEEGPSSGPFTLEPSPEAGDESFAKRMEAERPKEGNRHVILDTESSLDRKTGEKCGDCGREIRGDWDRFETPEGVICYVCSNQATHGMPQRTQSKKGARELAGDDYLLEAKTAPPAPEAAPWYFDPQSDTFKRVLLALAFSTIGIALFVSFFGVGTPSEEQLSAARETRETAPEIVLPLWANVVIWAWRGFAADLGIFITLFLVLDRANYLPRDSFKDNLIYIGMVVLSIAALQVVTGLSYVFLMPIFVVGGFLYVFVWAFSVLAQVIIVNRALDMRIRDWAWAMIVYFPLTQILLQSIGLFMYAGIYKLVA